MSFFDKIRSIFIKDKKDTAPAPLEAPVSAPAKKGENIIEIKGITKVFDGVTVLDNLSHLRAAARPPFFA